MTDTALGGLVKKLAAVMGTVTRMDKDEKNQQGWRYTSIMDMLDDIRPKLAAQGIIMVPDVDSVDWIEGRSRNDTPTTTCRMTVRWTVYDDGASLSFRTIGEALDTSDKAGHKALTAAQKQAVSKLMMISTGDPEDDADASHVERSAVQPRSATQPTSDLGTCPDHNVAWLNGKYGLGHPREQGKPWCNKAVEKAPPMPASAIASPWCAGHERVMVAGGYGVPLHWRTVNGRKESCAGIPAVATPLDDPNYREV